MAKKADLLAGVVAGVVGGLAASWIMNEFMSGLGPTITEAVQSDEEKRQQAAQSDGPKEDATMKAADAISHAATGQHLTRAQKEKGGPIVHYSFGALAGGIYGGLAEYSPAVRSGFGSSFGSVLFSTADLLAVPAFKLAPSPVDQPGSAQATPFAAHIVYGATTELVRRLVRWML